MQKSIGGSATFEQEFKDTRVLVTGGLGFIGSNLAIRLVGLGARVTIVDNLYESGGGNRFNLEPVSDKVLIIIDDIKKCEKIPELVNNSDYVLDLAAQVSHVDSMSNPALDLEMNCGAHLPLLEACRKSASNPKLIYTGSRVQYGRIKSTPVSENHPIEPVDNNGISKHSYEQYCLLYSRTYGLRATSLRLTNTYGPRNVMKHSKQGFVNWFVRLCIDESAIEIFGDGNQMRDFSYVEDVVDACLMAASTDHTNGVAYNVGGYPSPVRGVAETLKELRPRTRVEYVQFPEERKIIEIGNYVADYTRFAEITGWHPQIGLRDGIGRTLDYYEKFKTHYW